MTSEIIINPNYFNESFSDNELDYYNIASDDNSSISHNVVPDLGIGDMIPMVNSYHRNLENSGEINQ